MNGYPYQTYDGNRPQRGSAYHQNCHPQYRDNGSSPTNIEPASPYPGDEDSHQNFNIHKSQEPRYGPAPVEQHRLRVLGNRQEAPSDRHYEHPSTSPMAFPDLDQDFMSKVLEFTGDAPLITYRSRRLESPVAIPQISPGSGKSFLRSWAPILQNHDITMIDFLAFIDNLNVVSTANPPLQILDLAGGFVGMVPHHLAQLAGVVLQTSAKLGIALLTKGRTDMYMRGVNERMFNPRGLKATLASTQAMRAVLKMPLDGAILGPLNAQTINLSTVQRALIELEPYNALLVLDVPPPTEQITTLAKISAKQVDRLEKKNLKDAIKAREKAVKKDVERREEDKKKSDEKRRKEARKEKKHKEKYRKGKEEVNSDYESDELRDISIKMGDHDRDKNKDENNKEEKNAGKLLWILIENL